MKRTDHSGRKKILGITGGVGAGKSTILAYLQDRYGASVIQLDQVGHALMEPGGACYERILASFGRDILRDGRIDHGLLYAKAFAGGQDPSRLNDIIHPEVKREVLRQLALLSQEPSVPFIVLEAALLLEDHYDEICDEIWYVYVKEEARAQRLIRSRGYSAEKIREILKNQRSDAEFREKCQFVVDNSSDILENTYGQIDRGLREHEFV